MTRSGESPAQVSMTSSKDIVARLEKSLYFGMSLVVTPASFVDICVQTSRRGCGLMLPRRAAFGKDLSCVVSSSLFFLQQ